MKALSVDQIKKLVKSELSCGDCRGLNRDRLLPNADKACGAQGQLEDANICQHFRSNSYDLKEAFAEDGDKLSALFDLFSTMEPKTLRLIAGMLLSEHKTRNNGFKLGQPVFVRYRGRAGRNYMNNFMAARILDADNDSIRVTSEDGLTTLTYPNEERITKDAIYTRVSFAPLRKQMIREGKINDPEKEIKTAKNILPEEGVNFKAPKELDGFTVPMMADVVRGGKKKRSRTNTLVDMVDMIDSGYMMASDHDEDDEEDSVILGDNEYKSSGSVRKKKRVVKGRRNTSSRPVRLSKSGTVDLGDM